ncbi:hypothetical protein [Streptomyces sp. NPDC059262]|uniref:hypothetical protein n=1 Tax=Streptomyces sp. NPDC059262 TaxID=3346797 RepID=UPI0036962CF2
MALPDEATAGRLSVGGSVLHALPIALYRSTVFITTGSRMDVVDTVTGDVTATTRPKESPLDTDDEWSTSTPSAAPLVVTTQGSSSVLAAFVVQREGTGTQASRTMAEVTSTDPATGKVTWRLLLRLPDWASQSELTASMVGAEDGTAVVSLTTRNGSHAAAYGIDMGTQQPVWSLDNFRAGAVARKIVVGARLEDEVGVDQRPAGFSLASGERAWQGTHGTNVAAAPAEPTLIRMRGKDYDSGEDYDNLVDPRSGRTQQPLPEDLLGSACAYDDQSMLICSGTGAASLVTYGLDAATGKVKWQLPDEGADRIAPDVTAAWHGRVYGRANDKAVALDARTGKDLPSPGAAPMAVNESTGLVLDDSALLAYPTSG